MHPSDEQLSAYLDGELAPPDATAAAAHLRACAACAGTARRYAALDERLAAIPALGCGSALSLVSAKLDGELDREESAIAAAHLASCAACRADVLRWSVAERALAALPLARPSARVDAAIAALGRQPAGRRLPRIVWPVPALAVATVLSLFIVFDLSLGPSGPIAPGSALVAAVQQSVLNPANGILYVLHPDAGTVAALDAATLQPQTVIHVGGRPTALALNRTMTTLLVLDASAKTVTSIDCALNTITGSTAFAVAGTPTSLQVDQQGNVVVGAVAAMPAASAAPNGSPAPAGVLVVLNGGTGKVQAVKQVDVAPQVLVLEPNGRRALLVSADATTLVDASTYKALATAAGGIAAAFAASGDDFAILSRTANGASVSFARRSGTLVVGGTAQAIAALPDGGYAVLADLNGRGLITLIGPDGAIGGTLDAPANARDLAFDPSARQFAVIAPAGVTNVALPAAAVVVQQPAQTPAGTPLPTAPSTPKPSATPSPTPPASEAPVAIVAPRANDGLVPSNARAVWPGTYLVTLPQGQRPDRAIGDGTRIWYVDDDNRVSALNMTTGERFPIATLPAGATIGRLAVSPDHVYLLDPTRGVVYALTISTERLVTVPMPFAVSATSMTASPDERLWIGTPGAGLIGYDPRTGRTEKVAAGANLTALASDALGRIWIAARDRQAIDLYDPLNSTLTDVALTHGGSISALAVDRSGAIWIGADNGQLFAMRNSSLFFSGALGRPIDALVLDQNGAASFVSSGPTGTTYGSAAGLSRPIQAPVGSSGPIFDPLGRTWQADHAAGGFYVTLPEAAR
ncbi:MAG TPA: zf-HC2 domain-containing protein [Candidatus Limnocylindria bacterium]|nr:zf-HC2 domain-containing protein [Candidatus Limnocylindria bacterium]